MITGDDLSRASVKPLSSRAGHVGHVLTAVFASPAFRDVRATRYEPAAAEDAGTWLVDLDGTTALREETRADVRGPFAWVRVGEDVPNALVISVVRALAGVGHRVIYLSGRSDECRVATSAWIAVHIGVP